MVIVSKAAMKHLLRVNLCYWNILFAYHLSLILFGFVLVFAHFQLIKLSFLLIFRNFFILLDISPS